MNASDIKLTQYSHGSGCGCKIAPNVLDTILRTAGHPGNSYAQLLVGNDERDDAAVMDLGDGTAIISTTDFFMPVVDDPEYFGRIAAANAISDIYAMGGTPLMAVAILGWPLSMLSPEIAGLVIKGGQYICDQAGIPLAGGHSIDAPEPMFGLAVTGRVHISHLKKNGGARPGDILFLTKPLGIGILTTAQKLWKLNAEDAEKAITVMASLNTVGEQLGKIEAVHAMTDVTGFGLAGHLIEMCKASNVSSVLYSQKIPLVSSNVISYMQDGCVPGGANRNFESYGHHMDQMELVMRQLICDPQTSGGLLVAVAPDIANDIRELLLSNHVLYEPIGMLTEPAGHLISME